MSHVVTAVIDKLRIWHSGEWKTYSTLNSKLTNRFIRIHYDQLFILSENEILESLNLNGKIKGIYKDDVLILITCSSLQKVRKIKFQIKTNIEQCFHKLSLHFPVGSYNNSSNLQYQAKYNKVEDIIKKALNMTEVTTGQHLPPNFNDFIKLCLLDSSFPNIVGQTQDILKKMDV